MESEAFLPLIATRYLAAAGLTVLIYDHILLLDNEIRYIWRAKSSWFTMLFLFNHYSVPLILFINAFALGPFPDNISIQFCKNWVAANAVLPLLSLGIVNIFVAQRIYALWGSNKVVLKALYFGIGTAYASSFIVSAIGIRDSYSSITYNTALKMCLVQKISKLFAVGYGIPLILELSNFSLLCWNALDRPRHLHTVVIKQLYLDGIVYFLAITVLRVVNIIMLSGVLPRQYSLLFSFFIYAMVPTIVHRMILTLNDNIEDPSEPDDNLQVDYFGVYVKTKEWSNPLALRTISSSNSSFEITEERYYFTDSVL